MRHVKKAFLWIAVALGLSTAAFAQELRQELRPIDEMLAELANPETEDWERLERKILEQWSKSGSRTIDLLLQRGRDALEEEDPKKAIEHFTAVTDHAPGFAEGWNMRATAFFVIDRYGLSIEDVERALILNPNHFGALAGLGTMLERLGEDKSALEAYRRAQALHPHQERVNEAVERLTKSVQGRET